MSSTNRGGERSVADFYPTPKWSVHRFLESPTGDLLPGGIWIEAGAGEGAIIRAVNEVRKDVDWIACELRGECFERLARVTPSVRIGNFLGMDLEFLGIKEKAEVMFGNPPFHLALEFVMHGFTVAERVVQLLRLNFVESDDRVEFMRTYAPNLSVLPNRPSFNPNGNTDSCAYAWFSWPVEKERAYGAWEVLKSTPLAVRNLARAEIAELGLTLEDVYQLEMF